MHNNNYILALKAKKAGADVNTNDNFFLKRFAAEGDLFKVKCLVKIGVNKSQSCERTALVNAARNGHYKIVNYLINQGATEDIRAVNQALTFAKSNISLSSNSSEKHDEYHRIILSIEHFLKYGRPY